METLKTFNYRWLWFAFPIASLIGWLAYIEVLFWLGLIASGVGGLVILIIAGQSKETAQ
jgi:hypothetical protein